MKGGSQRWGDMGRRCLVVVSMGGAIQTKKNYGTHMNSPLVAPADPDDDTRRMPQDWLEVVFIVALFFVYAGCPTPDVNEAHYIAKAKHYWNPDWCAGDLFLESADAHLVFYWVFGWLTCLFSMPVVAWIGRWITWTLLAWSWQRLSVAIAPIRFASVLTAAWFVMLLDRFHLAGEWVIGGVEAKGFAYALVFCGLRAMVKGQWRAVWLWMGAGAAFHVLAGGWSVVIAAFVWFLQGRDRPSLRTIFPALVGGFLLSLPGLLPAIWLTSGVDPATTRLANEIYVFGRLGHHLSLHQMTPNRVVTFQWLVVVWIAISWRLSKWSDRAPRSVGECAVKLFGACEQPVRSMDAGVWQPWFILNYFTLGALLLASAGVVLDYALYEQPALAARLLRLYWFRAADIAVPMSVALAIPGLVVLVPVSAKKVHLALLGATIAIPCGFYSMVSVEHQTDLRPRAEIQSRALDRVGYESSVAEHQAWVNICRWISEETDPDARFLTPRGQQTFKWYTGRSEIVAWKDIPQDAKGIVHWWGLIQQIYPEAVQEGGLGAWTDRQLREICNRYDIDYVLIDRSETIRRIGFPRVYPNRSLSNASFELYDVR